MVTFTNFQQLWHRSRREESDGWLARFRASRATDSPSLLIELQLADFNREETDGGAFHLSWREEQ